MATSITTVDVTVENHGTVFIFQPHTQAARDWIEENVQGEKTWYGGGLVVEHRFAQELAAGMQADGLTAE